MGRKGGSREERKGKERVGEGKRGGKKAGRGKE